MRLGNAGGLLFLMLIGLSLPIACSPAGRFERVDHFPSGPQIDTFASAWLNRLHPSQVRKQFDARYEDVWETANMVARRLGVQVEKAAIFIDQDNGEIIITDELQIVRDTVPEPDDRSNLRRSSGSRLGGWKDEFLIHVTSLSEKRTMVTVSRTVLGVPRFRFCLYVAAMCESDTYEPEVSNGQIENWVLTQINDALAKPPTQVRVPHLSWESRF